MARVSRKPHRPPHRIKQKAHFLVGFLFYFLCFLSCASHKKILKLFLSAVHTTDMYDGRQVGAARFFRVVHRPFPLSVRKYTFFTLPYKLVPVNCPPDVELMR